MNSVKVVLKEQAERLGGLETGFFSEELRRQNKYDTEVCLPQWREAIKHITSNGFNPLKLLKTHGEQVLKCPQPSLTHIAEAYNEEESDNPLSEQAPLDMIPNRITTARFGTGEIQKLKEAKSGGIVINKDAYIAVKDSLPGFSLVFAYDSGSVAKNTSFPSLPLYGIPREAMGGIKGTRDKTLAFGIGELSLEGLAETAERRFMYTFATAPASDTQIIDALVKLNKFPTHVGQRPSIYEIRYRLVAAPLEELDPPRAAELLFDEAVEAQAQGLFQTVEALKLEAKELIYRDPVIVGVDHFNQKFPMIYWAGDKSDLDRLKK
ncbi:MAG: hypothetical protein ABH840_00375 [Nanoarchaeota archaeon]